MSLCFWSLCLFALHVNWPLSCKSCRNLLVWQERTIVVSCFYNFSDISTSCSFWYVLMMSYALSSFLYLSHTCCIWLHLFPHNDIDACPLAECYTSFVHKLAIFCVLHLFFDDITWILSHNYIGIVGKILNHGSKTPNFTRHLHWRKRMYVDRVGVQFPEHCNSERVDWCPELQWLQVHLTGHVQKAIQHLLVEVAASLEKIMKALDERFKPASQKTLYQAEFQTCRKKRSDTWTEFADDLRTLVDKGFPELQDETREQLSLEIYLQQLAPLQVAFSIKQKRPKTLDEAVAATIKMESYTCTCPRLPKRPLLYLKGWH